MVDNNQKGVLLCVCLISVFVLSACSSIPFMGEPDVPEVNAYTTSQSDKRSELQDEIEDFKSMKSSLSRLVSLESDLSFLLDEMSRFNEKNPIMYEIDSTTNSNTSSPNSKIVYSSNGKKEYTNEQTDDGWAKSLGDMADSWKSEAGERQKLGIARQNSRQGVSELSAESIQSASGMMNTKFSSGSQVEISPATPVMDIDSPSENMADKLNLDKFAYNSNPQNIVGDSNNCSDWKVDPVQTYSLHLASYKSQKSAEDGWNQLDKKYSDIWCQTDAKLAKVIVKGTEYLSLRVGGYDSKDKVLQLCSILKERGDYCAVSLSEGSIIQ